MSEFSARWLDLREPADVAARSARLAGRLAQVRGGMRPLRIVDLGAGTGANLRYLAPRLGGEQHWRIIDHDAAMLAAARRRLERWAEEHGYGYQQTYDGGLRVAGIGFEARVQPVSLDLSRQIPAAELADADVVSASALLDLVSEPWLLAMLTRCRSQGAALLFALTYDGEIACSPPDAFDANVRALVNRHQGGDKGFGPALGPAAPARTVNLLRALGYGMEEEPSGWHLGPGDEALQGALIDGWAAAAREVEPGERDLIERWRERRQALLRSGESRLRVGHRDVLGWIEENEFRG